MSRMSKMSKQLGKIYAFASKQRECELKLLQSEYKNILASISSPSSLTKNFFKTTDTEIQPAQKWALKMFEYNLSDGKLNRAVALLATYRLLKPEDEEGLKRAAILGWCVEMFQTYFLIFDDIMDGSVTRRGKPCWYKQSEVGMIAVNDGTILQSIIFNLLARNFQNLPCYNQMIALMNEAFRITGYGQCLDVLTEKATSPSSASNNNSLLNIDCLTFERYESIVKHKTSFYSFVLPMRLALYAAGIFDTDLHEDVENILLDIGHVFQVQDDYLDCFADPKVLGKIGTDIRDGKCSWLVVKALSIIRETGNETQRSLLEENYGRLDDAEAEACIKTLYDSLNMTQHYQSTVDSATTKIFARIDEFQLKYGGDKLPEKLFYQPLAQIYKRQK